MAFNVHFEMVNNIARITLIGKMNTFEAPQFKAEVEKAIKFQAKRFVLMVDDLEYIASSGLRILILIKQAMGPKVDIFIVSPQPLIREILEMTGFHYGVIILDEYDAKQIENF